MGERGKGPQLQLEVRRAAGSAPVVEVRGELDAYTCDQFQDCLDELGGSDVVLDLTELRLIDSLCLTVLVRTHHRLAGSGNRLVLADPQPIVRQVLELTGLDQVLAVRY